MGRRTLLPKYQVFISADTTLNPESDISEVASVDFITYEVAIDPTVSADLEVHYCNDSKIDADSVFKPLNFIQPTPLDGSVDVGGVVHIKNLGFKQLKLVLVNSVGSGNINAWISGNVRGA